MFSFTLELASCSAFSASNALIINVIASSPVATRIGAIKLPPGKRSSKNGIPDKRHSP